MTSTTLPTPTHPALPARPPASVGADPPPRLAPPRQLSKAGALGVWAAAAAPMGLAMWVIGPAIADRLNGPQALTRSLIAALTVGLAWQCVLVVALVAREQRTLHLSTIRSALWLRAPISPRTGRVGGRTWLAVAPLMLVFAAEELIPKLPHPASRDLGSILQSPAGQQFLRGSWGWFAVLVTMFMFNTALGEELLFRGYLLPRMHDAFGERDWLANGLLFAAYHVHVPWAMPGVLVDTFVLARSSKRYRSAWIGIAVHSTQTVFFTAAALAVVLK